MEAFSYQQILSAFLVDSLYLQHEHSPMEMTLLQEQGGGERSNASSSSFTCYNNNNNNNNSCVELLPTPHASSENRRKQSDGSCLSTGQSKGVKGSKSRRLKKSMTEEKQPNAEPPSGYIHVRARRGQATDSHSLAERVRRERISERMKKLQGLVPGCDKVIGKALVLDEIINYVQSLQNQVEFLSMKLASANPVVYDFGADFNDEIMNQPEELGSMSQPMPSVIQHTTPTPTAFEGAANNFQPVDSSVIPFSLQGQGPTSFSQDSGSFLMKVGEQARGFLGQAELNNMCSFH